METDILDNDIYFTNIIPSVWLGYIVGKPNIEISTKLKKFCVLKKMKKIVRLDKDIDYWHKSRDYINEIKNQMLKNEIERLTKIDNIEILGQKFGSELGAYLKQADVCIAP